MTYHALTTSPAGMTAGSMYGTMTSAFSASRNGRTSEVLGEGSNPMQSLDMGSKRQSAAGEFDQGAAAEQVLSILQSRLQHQMLRLNIAA
jgi:hypothetical protein